MSGTPDAGSDSQGFTCGTLLMCLYLPGLSKKKPEAEAAAAAASGPVDQQTLPAPSETAEKMPLSDAPSRNASLEKSECALLYSSNNIVFDFVDHEEHGGRQAIHGYCPSPCFDLPVEMIRAGERFGAVAGAADRDAPVTAAFVFGDGEHRGGGCRI